MRKVVPKLLMALAAILVVAQRSVVAESTRAASDEVIRVEPAMYRYIELSGQERRALRRSYKLPMDAIFRADSLSDLSTMAVVAPLPDPTKPLLATAHDASTDNPFGPASAEHPLGVLSELFEGLPAVEQRAAPSSDDPFGDDLTSETVGEALAADGAEDPFAGSDGAAPSGAASSDEAESSDPLTDSFDDAGFEDDPFAF